MQNRTKYDINCSGINYALLIVQVDLKTTKHTLCCPTWLETKIEFDALIKKQSYNLFHILFNKIPIGCQWVIQVKEKINDTIIKNIRFIFLKMVSIKKIG